MSITPLYEFLVKTTREVPETTTREEGGKTISETVKVTKPVSIPFMFKKPSREEREEADLQRSIWWSKFFEAGVLPHAILIKRYSDAGGILDTQDRAIQHQLMQAEQEWIRLTTLSNKTDEEKAAVDTALRRFLDLRQSFIEIQQQQAPFFENTAENKARQKLIEWLILHLVYYKPEGYLEGTDAKEHEKHEWKPFFAGDTIEEKLRSFDKMVEDENELFIKARPTFEFFATVWASSDGNVTKEEVEAFAANMKEPEEVVQSPA